MVRILLTQTLLGDFSGIISGAILELGAATEVVAPEADGVKTVSRARLMGGEIILLM